MCIHSFHENKSPLKIWEKREVGVSRDWRGTLPPHTPPACTLGAFCASILAPSALGLAPSKVQTQILDPALRSSWLFYIAVRLSDVVPLWDPGDRPSYSPLRAHAASAAVSPNQLHQCGGEALIKSSKHSHIND